MNPLIARMESDDPPRLLCRLLGHSDERVRDRNGVTYSRCRRCGRREALSFRGADAIDARWVALGEWTIVKIRPMPDRWGRGR